MYVTKFNKYHTVKYQQIGITNTQPARRHHKKKPHTSLTHRTWSENNNNTCIHDHITYGHGHTRIIYVHDDSQWGATKFSYTLRYNIFHYLALSLCKSHPGNNKNINRKISKIGSMLLWLYISSSLDRFYASSSILIFNTIKSIRLHFALFISQM